MDRLTKASTNDCFALELVEHPVSFSRTFHNLEIRFISESRAKPSRAILDSCIFTREVNVVVDVLSQKMIVSVLVLRLVIEHLDRYSLGVFYPASDYFDPSPEIAASSIIMDAIRSSTNNLTVFAFPNEADLVESRLHGERKVSRALDAQLQRAASNGCSGLDNVKPEKWGVMFSAGDVATSSHAIELLIGISEESSLPPEVKKESQTIRLEFLQQAAHLATGLSQASSRTDFFTRILNE